MDLGISRPIMQNRLRIKYPDIMMKASEKLTTQQPTNFTTVFATDSLNRNLFVGLVNVFPDNIQKITIAWLAGEFMCKTVKFLQIWMSLVSAMIFVIPALAIAACYCVIVLTIWTKSKAVVMSHIESDPDSRRASSRGLIPRAKIKSVKMTFVIVFVFDLLQVYDYIPKTQTSIAVATFVQSLAPLNSAANPLICCMFSPHIYASLRRVPPYKWLWWGKRRTRHARGTLRSRSDSTANSDLISTTHARRTHSVAT
ncbi:Neuropeptide receptor A26, partial [Operophtera brumata]